ncbi:MAG: acetyl-CoA carboxylase biotin carboxyl carrier protein subunit [Gammaproteobacteria bacterium]|nr:acetyl-CoA carboxylase biotin carboxyl carrier protein subunit [Gammaproteobacteria bacterium]MDE0413584.1 acetyl-CoA carboxylase biotin carboxyl carrier protein subunit [Gammaproteobacteria bacterium]
MAEIRCPMTGVIARIMVEIGDTVTIGDTVAVMESMKMEILIQADTGGRIKSIHASVDETVEEGDLLFECE